MGFRKVPLQGRMSYEHILVDVEDGVGVVTAQALSTGEKSQAARANPPSSGESDELGHPYSSIRGAALVYRRRTGLPPTLCWREMDSNFRFRCVRRS